MIAEGETNSTLIVNQSCQVQGSSKDVIFSYFPEVSSYLCRVKQIEMGGGVT